MAATPTKSPSKKEKTHSGKSVFSQHEKDALIEEVHVHTCLWNLTDLLYQSDTARGNAWAEIGASLGKSGDLCKHEWNLLRGSYRSAKSRLLKKKTGSAAPDPSSTSSILDSMAFLETSSRNRITISNFEEEKKEEYEPGIEIYEAEGQRDGEEIKFDISEALSSTATTDDLNKSRKRKSSKAEAGSKDEFEAQVMNVLKSYTQSAANESDESSIFGSMLTSSLRSLSDLNREILKKNIQDLIFEAKMADRGQVIEGTKTKFVIYVSPDAEIDIEQ